MKIFRIAAAMTILLGEVACVSAPPPPPVIAEDIAADAAIEICAKPGPTNLTPRAKQKAVQAWNTCMRENMSKLMPAAIQAAALENSQRQQQYYQQNAGPSLMQRLGSGLANAEKQNAAIGQQMITNMPAAPVPTYAPINHSVQTNCFQNGNYINCNTNGY